MASKYENGLSAGQYVDLLRADFSGMENLEKIISGVLKRLMINDYRSSTAFGYGISFNQWAAGSPAMDETGKFAEMVRSRLGAALAVARQKAVNRALGAGAGSASYAVHRNMYKNRIAANINILETRKGRISNRRRIYEQGHQRSVSKRTIQLNEYYGPDRAFILRFLNSGTIDRYVNPKGATGNKSRATWGNRGSIPKKNFFESMRSDMEQAAKELGIELTGMVKEYLETNFIEL